MPGRRLPAGKTHGSGTSSGGGSPGPQGDPGATGPQGPIGFPGEDGEPGFFVPGAKGDTGAAGADGATGAPGSQGPQGIPGASGEDGDSFFGVPGTTGAQGAQGVPGNDGAAGAAGAAGAPGIAGEDGDTPTYPVYNDILKLQGYPGGSTFLRADGTFAAPAGAPPAATTVEKDLGSTAKTHGNFTISDAGIGASSKVMVWQAPGPYTNKGTQADEADMQPVRVNAVTPSAGSCKVWWETPPITVQRPLDGNFGAKGPVSTTVATQDIIEREAQLARSQWEEVRIGKVRGNVKFSYVIFA